jgi:hypothetical protein
MKISRLETHDRYDYLIKDQAHMIAQGASDCLKKNSDSLKLQELCPYVYIFAHPRTEEDGGNKRLLWQPRLTKPKAQTNSYLFRAESKTDLMEICWILPPRELWPQYQKGNICASDHVRWSINHFIHNRRKLEDPFVGDLTDSQARAIWTQILTNKDHGTIKLEI